MGYGNYWSNPFRDESYRDFFDLTQERWRGNGVVEYQPLTWVYLLGADASDTGSLAQPLIVDVIDRASAKATGGGPTDTTAAATGLPGSVTTRPQEPKIDESGIVPVGTSILVGGMAVVVVTPLIRLRGTVVDVAAGAVSPAAAADDVIAGIQAAFDCAVLQLRDARNAKASVKGHDSTSYGSSRVAAMGPPIETADGVVDSLLYAGQVPAKDRGWASIQPVLFDGGGPDRPGMSQSQMKLLHIIPRSSTWPVETATRIRVEVMLPSLIGYAGSSSQSGGGDCLPPSRALPPPPPGYYVPGKTRW